MDMGASPEYLVVVLRMNLRRKLSLNTCMILKWSCLSLGFEVHPILQILICIYQLFFSVGGDLDRDCPIFCWIFFLDFNAISNTLEGWSYFCCWFQHYLNYSSIGLQCYYKKLNCSATTQVHPLPTFFPCSENWFQFTNRSFSFKHHLWQQKIFLQCWVCATSWF